MKLYQYSILFVPKTKESKKEEKPKVLVPVTEILAEDDAKATIMASRAIPEAYLDRLAEVTLAVRPF